MFLTIEASLAICKQYSGIDADDFTWDTSLTAFLEASRAIESYRPILIAAMQVLKFSSGITRGSLSSAEGVKWITPGEATEAIAGYLMEQEALDGSLTGIPASWSILVLRPKLCGCDPVAVASPIFSALYA